MQKMMHDDDKTHQQKQMDSMRTYLRTIEEECERLQSKEAAKNGHERKERALNKAWYQYCELKSGAIMLVDPKTEHPVPFDKYEKSLRESLGATEDEMQLLRARYKTRGMIRRSLRHGEWFDPWSKFIDLPEYLKAKIRNSYRLGRFNNPLDWD